MNKMRRSTYITVLTAMLTLTASCGKESCSEEEFHPEVRICTDGASIKAGGQDIYQGSSLGLFIDYGSAASSKYSIPNVKWERNGANWTPEKQMLWKDASTSTALYAYAPHIDRQNNHDTIMFTVPGDQQNGTEEADLVSWSRADFTPNSSDRDFVDGKVQINFSHRLVKLTVNLSLGTDIPENVSISGVTLMGTSQKVTLSLDTQTVTNPQGSLDISMHKADELKYEAIFYPGSGQEAGARMLCVTMSNGAAYYFTVPDTGLLSEGLQGGKSYGMNLRVGRDKITLQDSEGILIMNWSSYDGDLPEGVLKPSGFAGGIGTAGNPFLISNETELRHFAQLVGSGTSFYGKYIQLTQNISVNGDFAPIGNLTNYFEGHFDGAGNSIDMSNANPTMTNKACSFFYAVWGRDSLHMASVKNLRIHNMNINSTSDDLVSASLLCISTNYALIKGCEVSGSICYKADNCRPCLGGIAVIMYDSTVEDCRTDVEFSHTGGSGKAWIGGICQRLEFSGTIRNCEIISDASEEMRMGGIVEYCRGNIIVEGCTVMGIFGKMPQFLGGMFGEMNSGTYNIKGCSVNAMLTNENYYCCGGFAGSIMQGAGGKFEDCGFNGSYDYYRINNNLAFGEDKSDMEFINCWYSQEAYDSSNHKIGDFMNPAKKYDIKLKSRT